MLAQNEIPSGSEPVVRHAAANAMIALKDEIMTAIHCVFIKQSPKAVQLIPRIVSRILRNVNGIVFAVCKRRQLPTLDELRIAGDSKRERFAAVIHLTTPGFITGRIAPETSLARLASLRLPAPLGWRLRFALTSWWRRLGW